MPDTNWVGLIVIIVVAGLFALAVAFRPGANREEPETYEHEPGEERLPDK
jgi:hypothetical protein